MNSVTDTTIMKLVSKYVYPQRESKLSNKLQKWIDKNRIWVADDRNQFLSSENIGKKNRYAVNAKRIALWVLLIITVTAVVGTVFWIDKWDAPTWGKSFVLLLMGVSFIGCTTILAMAPDGSVEERVLRGAKLVPYAVTTMAFVLFILIEIFTLFYSLSLYVYYIYIYYLLLVTVTYILWRELRTAWLTAKDSYSYTHVKRIEQFNTLLLIAVIFFASITTSQITILQKQNYVFICVAAFISIVLSQLVSYFLNLGRNKSVLVESLNGLIDRYIVVLQNDKDMKSLILTALELDSKLSNDIFGRRFNKVPFVSSYIRIVLLVYALKVSIADDNANKQQNATLFEERIASICALGIPVAEATTIIQDTTSKSHPSGKHSKNVPAQVIVIRNIMDRISKIDPDERKRDLISFFTQFKLEINEIPFREFNKMQYRISTVLDAHHPENKRQCP